MYSILYYVVLIESTMATATGGLPLRDDASGRSLSSNERSFARRCATNSSSSVTVRSDGRHPTEARPLRLTLSRSHGAAECVVRLGSGTRVTASVSCDLVPPPNRDRPNDGQIRFSVDLSPMSCLAFGGGGPVYSAGGSGGAPPADEAQRLLSNRILRTLERTLLAGGAIDSEALCVQSGRWVWRLSVDVVCLDHGGNLVDASLLAAVAGLRHFRKPEVEISDAESGGGNPIVLNSDEREPSPLPLHHTPLSVTFALFSDRDMSEGMGTVAALIDPTEREEMVSDGLVTLSYNKHGELCGFDYPGGTELRPSQLMQCARLGEKRCGEWCGFLEDALKEADEKASKERMGRLKAAANIGGASGVALPEVSDGVPFVERTDPERDGDMMEIDAGDEVVEIGANQARAAAEAQAAEEEEQYRLRALDYTLGHVAAKVKEDRDKDRRTGGGGAGLGANSSSSLMSAMLKSVAASGTSEQSPKTTACPERMVVDSSVGKDESPVLDASNKTKLLNKPATKDTSLDSDDEEDEVTMLQSEFVREEKPTESPKAETSVEGGEHKDSEKKKKPSTEAMEKEHINDDDIDDLAMAVVKKKKSKKGKKSKK